MHHSSCWVGQRVAAGKDRAVILFVRISLPAMCFLRGMQDTRALSAAAGSGHPSGWGHSSGPVGQGSTPICQRLVCEPGWLALLGEAPRASSSWALRSWGSGPSTAPCPPGPAVPEPQGLFPGTPPPGYPFARKTCRHERRVGRELLAVCPQWGTVGGTWLGQACSLRLRTAPRFTV